MTTTRTVPIDAPANQAKLLAELTAHLRAESIAFADVHAEVVAGVVQLSGQVASRALQMHAEELARTIPGVHTVRNLIQVSDNGGDPLPTTPRDEIAAAVDYAVQTDARLAHSQIRVRNDHGVIHLHGTVNTIAEQLLAENLATTQPGVTRVVNELVVDHA